MLAVRYLNPLRTMFSVITLICLGGVALGVMVLIVVLSVMEGLQQEMESRVLAFSPHYVASRYVGDERTAISDETVDWQAAMDRIRELPGVDIVYPQVESDGFVQSLRGRSTAHFVAIQPHNEGQLKPLLPMLKAGSFDFGDGLNDECVVSMALATQLGVGLGDSVTLTPLGSVKEIADVYAMIQHPLQTQENETFLRLLDSFFDGAVEAEGGVVVSAEKLKEADCCLRGFNGEQLREGEKEICTALYEMLEAHADRAVFSADEQERWRSLAQAVRELDRDREDGKAVKSVNRMVMPVDLQVVGVYQPPENMPGPDVYLPLEIAQNSLGYNAEGISQIQGICVRSEEANAADEVGERILSLLTGGGFVSPEDPGDWGLMPWTRSLEVWYKMIANERVMMSFVLSIISLIASFCIMAVMFTMSMQRRREIAVLQALGATPGKIMGIFAWQGVMIGLAGSVLGVGLALLVLYYRLDIQAALAAVGMDPFPMQAHGIVLPANYDPATFVWQAFKAFLMVTVASMIPAFFVSRQNPSKVLRSN